MSGVGPAPASTQLDFDILVTNPVGAWANPGELVYSQASASNVSNNGNRLKLGGAVLTTTWAGGGLFSTGGLAATGSDWPVLEFLDVVTKLLITNFASLVANAMAGIELTDQAITSAPILSTDITVSPTVRRVTVGVDSSGLIQIVTCNGAAVTVTSSGVTAVTGVPVTVRIQFTKGTNIIVTVNGIATTVAATLPTRLVAHAVGVLQGSAVPGLSTYGGAFKLVTT